VQPVGSRCDIDFSGTDFAEQCRACSHGASGCENIIDEQNRLPVQIGIGMLKAQRRIDFANLCGELVLPQGFPEFTEQIAAGFAVQLCGESFSEQLRVGIALYPPPLLCDRHPCDTADVRRIDNLTDGIGKHTGGIAVKPAFSVFEREDAASGSSRVGKGTRTSVPQDICIGGMLPHPCGISVQSRASWLIRAPQQPHRLG